MGLHLGLFYVMIHYVRAEWIDWRGLEMVGSCWIARLNYLEIELRVLRLLWIDVPQLSWPPELEAGACPVASLAAKVAALATEERGLLVCLAGGGIKRTLGIGGGVSSRTLLKNAYKACLFSASTGRILPR